MITTIEACSFDEAYMLFLDDHEEYSDFKCIKKPINDIDDSAYESLDLLFYYMDRDPGENVNQTQTKVLDKPSKGTKKWETKYIVVDQFNSLLLRDTNFKFKKEAVDAARAYTNEHYVSSYILLGKSLEGSDRIQAQIDYKPAPSQKEGEWVFIC